MATYKDILYKMEGNETWTEWAKRVPDNDEDKLDYIGETIYDICIWDDKKNAYKITEMMIELGLEQLIPLLENEDLLNAKIEEVYKGLCQKESLKSLEEDQVEDDDKNEDEDDKNEDDDDKNEDEDEDEDEEEEVEDRRQTHTVKEPWKSMLDEMEEEEEVEEMADAKHRREYCETHGEEYDDECWYEAPIKTITVKQMMIALDKLPRNAQLVITEEGFYSHTEFAKMMLPEPYTIKNKIPRLPDGTPVYRIGHSKQNYSGRNY